MRDEVLRHHIADQVRLINGEVDASKRSSMLDAFIRMLKDEGLDCDKMSYDNGVVQNTYINFDSICGLSCIDAFAPLDAILSDGTQEVKDLADLINPLSEYGSRHEYWNDLLEEGTDRFVDTLTPEEIAAIIVSVREPWKGEEDLRKDLKIA